MKKIITSILFIVALANVNAQNFYKEIYSGMPKDGSTVYSYDGYCSMNIYHDPISGYYTRNFDGSIYIMTPITKIDAPSGQNGFEIVTGLQFDSQKVYDTLEFDISMKHEVEKIIKILSYDYGNAVFYKYPVKSAVKQGKDNVVAMFRSSGLRAGITIEKNKYGWIFSKNKNKFNYKLIVFIYDSKYGNLDFGK